MTVVNGRKTGETYTINGNTITAVNTQSSGNFKTYKINGQTVVVPSYCNIYEIEERYCQPKQNNDYYTNAIESNNKRQKRLEGEVKELKSTQSALEDTIEENNKIIHKVEADFGENVEESCDNQSRLDEYHEAIDNRSDAKKAKSFASMREVSNLMSLFNLALDTGKLKMQQILFGR
jgi:predicted RNase H-like nuclease (RuvC/YqgF family)